MRLKVIRADASLKHVALLGRLDIQGVNDIQYEFQQETTVGPIPTVVDLSKVTYIASLGIGMLVSAAKYMERSGVRMVLLSPSAMVSKALLASGLDHVIPIADGEAAALELLR